MSSPEATSRQDDDGRMRYRPEAGPDELRRVFRRQAAGVGIVTTSYQGAPVGLLVTSLVSVSASPPLVSFNVARTASSWPALEQAEHIGVHVLAADQQDLAARFARAGTDRFLAPTSWQSGPYGVPLIDDVAAWAVAVVEQRFDAGDHVIIVARLLHADARDEAAPLVHHDGEYRQVSPGSAGSESHPAGSRLTVIRSADQPEPDRHPLDNPAWSSLTGPHARFAEGTSRAVRYPADMSPFHAIPSIVDDDVWSDLEKLAGPGQEVFLSGPPSLLDRLPEGWQVGMRLEGVQLVGTDAFVTAEDPEAIELGADDVEEMLDLVARTEPGPFKPRTYQLGTYLGIRRGGALVAMAGERMHPPGWTEISAVCTDPAFRGQGLAARLVRAIGHGIRARGERPLMHASAANTKAIRLYESIGFAVRKRPGFFGLRTPDQQGLSTPGPPRPTTRLH